MKKVLIAAILAGIAGLIWEITSITFKLSLSTVNLMFFTLGGLITGFFILYMALRISMKGEIQSNFTFQEVFKRGVFFSLVFALVMVAGVYVYFSQNPDEMQRINRESVSRLKQEGILDEETFQRTTALLAKNNTAGRLAIGQFSQVLMGSLFSLICAFLLRNRKLDGHHDTPGKKTPSE